jgi:hypothetical protein
VAFFEVCKKKDLFYDLNWHLKYHLNYNLMSLINFHLLTFHL